MKKPNWLHVLGVVTSFHNYGDKKWYLFGTATEIGFGISQIPNVFKHQYTEGNNITFNPFESARVNDAHYELEMAPLHPLLKVERIKELAMRSC